jgi:hypothetical protein
METKLTLRLKKKTIEKGKAFAKKRNTSLSKLIENYIDKVTEELPSYEDISPLVKSLSGVVREPEADYKSGYARFLKKKYK